jgi:hypothetical protein
MNSTEFAQLNEELDRDAEDAARWRKLCEFAYQGEALRAICYAPCGNREEVYEAMNSWIDNLHE